MSKIYIKGGAIIVEGVTTETLVINPAHFDYQKKGSDFYVRDGIENQSYNIGAIGAIEDVNDSLFSSETDLLIFLNGLVNRTDVKIQDQTTDVVNLYLNRELSTFTLDGVQTVDSHIINVVTGHSVVAGNYVCLQQKDTVRNILRFFQAEVVTAGATTLEVSRPLDFAYDPSQPDFYCSKATRVNLVGEVGTIGSPIVYKIAPQFGAWDIYQIHFVMFSPSGTFDDGTFGPIAKLTHGITLRRKNGYTQNMINLKSNGELLGYSESSPGYSTKPPAGTGAGLTATISMKDGNGVATRLDSAKGGSLELWLPDSLAAWPAGGELEIKAEGHVVEE